ncbi:uncharacterized protein LOC131146171 [Malania oleifera]|uniref:uncharacterized protein LOC131146171 n=1 Tax=Malania oleifera TaxID=397392 RepID=UPI0025AE8523|nr:uncharacterized protein LOC131146171 [Malania oleifera]XP_057951533.1 uncharacterized protein LOC131146171 [Malania oleifera]XP_057951534.1 uncharacterized protein LOC131146171 [Malania oleifera]
MNRCAYQQSVSATCDVVCPKPRRFGPFSPAIHDHIPPWRYHINNNYPAEISDSKAGVELLDTILTKGNSGAEKSNNFPAASSPPFFCGSPPSRTSNPVILDAQFNNEKLEPPPAAAPPLATSPSAARKGGGCVRVSFGPKPPAARIEGFDCLRGDRQNRSISAVA